MSWSSTDDGDVSRREGRRRHGGDMMMIKKAFLGTLVSLLALGAGVLFLGRLPGQDALASEVSSTPVVRLEQDSSSVNYSGAWFNNSTPSSSGGSAVLSMDPGANATFTFTGTAVRWFGTSDEWSGIARVFLDGTLQAIVDGYASPGQSQAVLYAASGLPAAGHTLVIEVTGTRNSASNGSWV